MILKLITCTWIIYDYSTQYAKKYYAGDEPFMKVREFIEVLKDSEMLKSLLIVLGGIILYHIINNSFYRYVWLS